MATELTVQKQVNPLLILQEAVDKGADIEKLTALMQLAERWEANEAKKAFNVAFSAFKSEAVTIVKNVDVKDGPLKGKKYADKFGVVGVVTPILSKHGLSHSWKLTKDEKEWMEVTCTIKHVLGHSETASMGSAPDTGAGRNAIQARSSANSYLERITLLAITGMAASDEDDDGNGFQQTAKENVVDDLLAAPTTAALQSMFSTAYMLAAKRPESQKAFKEAYEKRKAQLAKKEGE